MTTQVIRWMDVAGNLWLTEAESEASDATLAPKLCPFCGSYDSAPSGGGPTLAIRCNNCGAYGPEAANGDVNTAWTLFAERAPT